MRKTRSRSRTSLDARSRRRVRVARRSRATSTRGSKYFNMENDSTDKRASREQDKIIMMCEVEESEVAVGAVVGADSDGDDDGIRDDEIISSDDEHVDRYVKDTDERVMLPLANVSNRTEMTCVGNLDENMQVQGDDSRPARDKAKENFARISSYPPINTAYPYD